jgi:hypothetical protein
MVRILDPEIGFDEPDTYINANYIEVPIFPI